MNRAVSVAIAAAMALSMAGAVQAAGETKPKKEPTPAQAAHLGTYPEDLPRTGDYVFGWTRSQDALKVSFYQAATGKEVGQVDAVRNPSITRVESFRIWPPHGAATEPHSVIQIGRFSFPYLLTK